MAGVDKDIACACASTVHCVQALQDPIIRRRPRLTCLKVRVDQGHSFRTENKTNSLRTLFAVAGLNSSRAKSAEFAELSCHAATIGTPINTPLRRTHRCQNVLGGARARGVLSPSIRRHVFVYFAKQHRQSRHALLRLHCASTSQGKCVPSSQP